MFILEDCSKKYLLTSEEEETAIKAAKVLGLSVAGVDLIQSNKGISY